MGILVDPSQWPHRGGLWCHMVSDVSVEELHQLARRIGVPRVAFQGDHYDLDESTRQRAIDAGAREVSAREVVRTLDASGLRRGPSLQRRGLAGVGDLPAPMLPTKRLELRQWTELDRGPFARLNADPRVGDWLGGAISLEQSNTMLDRNAVHLALRGFGLWSVHERDTDSFIGAVGLLGVGPEFSFSPALELVWRVDPNHQGRGFASEAAFAAANYAHETLEVHRVAAFTSVGNLASLRVMEHLNMRTDEFLPNGEFDHPRLAAGHPLRRHQLRWWHAPVN